MSAKRYLQFDLQGNQTSITNLTESQVQEDVSNIYVEIDNEFDISKTYILNLENRSLIDISETLLIKKEVINKTKEIKSFYEEMREFFIKKDSYSLKIIANQDWFNNLSNIRSYLEDYSEKQGVEKSTLSYDYNLYNEENDLLVIIPLSYFLIREISMILSKRRSYCRVTCDYHISKIKELNILNSIIEYDYKKDTEGNIVEKLTDFIITL